MTNRQFAELLVSKIEHHKHKLCDGKNDPVTASYALAHDHIIELIYVLKPAEDELTAMPAHWIGKKIDKSHYHYFCSHCYYESRADVDLRSLAMDRPLVFDDLLVNLSEVIVIKKDREI